MGRKRPRRRAPQPRSQAGGAGDVRAVYRGGGVHTRGEYSAVPCGYGHNIPHRLRYLLRKQIGRLLFSLSKVRIPVQICFCHIRLNRHNTDTILTHLIKKTPGKAAESRFRCPISTAMRITELPQFKVIESVALSRADGYKTTDNNIYRAHPQDGPATYSKYDGKGPLVVRVFSFSYRKGIPEDPSGNGGGYVFDCRSTHNPGRYEPYKKLTGLDEPVIRFLEDDGEILKFLDHVYALADHHVNRYMQRGFTSLMFCFGCTGGQHRSVYSAQHLAEHIHRKFGVEVHICHREQHIEQVLPAKQ